MASPQAGTSSAWVVEVDKTLEAANAKAALRRRHSVYRVPAHIKNLNSKAYQPQVVSLGPFHHGDPDLLPMEEHKRRAVWHRLRRAGKTLEQFAAAVEEVAPQLEDAYQDLGGEWRCQRNRCRFMELMIMDGCFLLEMMGTAASRVVPNDYAPDDPVFSRHGELYMVPYIRRDMLMIENQLPLLVLVKLLAVERGKQTNKIEESVNEKVLRFLSPSFKVPPAPGRGLHPLDVFRKSLLHGPYDNEAPHSGSGIDDSSDIIRRAADLHDAGVRLRSSETDSLHDISFHRGVLSLPAITVDDSTEYMFLNVMAFERLHVGTGNSVTAYAFLMSALVTSTRDVALLSARGIIQRAVGTDHAVAKLFGDLAVDAVLEPDSELDAVHRMVNEFCRKPWNTRRANLLRTYFRDPWAWINVTAIVVFVMTTIQTIYTVLQYYHGNRS